MTHVKENAVQFQLKFGCFGEQAAKLGNRSIPLAERRSMLEYDLKVGHCYPIVKVRSKHKQTLCCRVHFLQSHESAVNTETSRSAFIVSSSTGLTMPA